MRERQRWDETDWKEKMKMAQKMKNLDEEDKQTNGQQKKEKLKHN